jgi:hypothetical protein
MLYEKLSEVYNAVSSWFFWVRFWNW